MPFNSETGAVSGKRGGLKRWVGKDQSTVRNVSLRINVSRGELAEISCKAQCTGVSRTDLIVMAVRQYMPEQNICNISSTAKSFISGEE